MKGFVEVELVDRVRIGDGEEVAVGVLRPVVADGVDPLDEQHVVGVDGADCDGDAAGELDPLTLRLGHDRLVEQVVAGDRRFVPAVARDLGPQAHEAILQVGARPQGLAGAQRLEPARRHVHVEHEVHAVLLRPRNVVVQPLPAIIQVLAGRGVRFERAVVHVEADRVHSHRGDALEVGLVVVAARQAHIAPDVVAEGDAAQGDHVTGAVDDLRAAHAQELRRSRARTGIGAG